KVVARLETPRHNSPEEASALGRRVKDARDALVEYHKELKKNTSRGDRADDGFDELSLAFKIDHDLTAILAELNPGDRAEPVSPGACVWLRRDPEGAAEGGGALADEGGLAARIERLNHRAMELPGILHRELYDVLVKSKGQYEASRAIVWVSALAVLGM